MKYFPALILFVIFFIAVVEPTSGQNDANTDVADSLFIKKEWASAKTVYRQLLINDSSNSLLWNKLGFCNQNLQLYGEAISNYQTALANKPGGMLKSIIMLRMSMVYSKLNETTKATDYLLKASSLGYNSLKDLDSLDAFKNLRAVSGYKDLRKTIYEMVYPCSKEPRNRDFDFWIGDWSCYRTGTQILSGYSHVESMAGGCAILENFTSVQAYDGKSFNYYDTVAGSWEQNWIGSGGASDRQRYYNGVFKDGKMHFIYETTNPGGQKVKGNFIFYFINQDSVRQYQDVMDTAGKTISVTYDLMYRRRK